MFMDMSHTGLTWSKALVAAALEMKTTFWPTRDCMIHPLTQWQLTTFISRFSQQHWFVPNLAPNLKMKHS